MYSEHSETDSVDSFPANDDASIERESTILIGVDVNRDVEEDSRNPKSKQGQKAEALLVAVR